MKSALLKVLVLGLVGPYLAFLGGSRIISRTCSLGKWNLKYRRVTRACALACLTLDPFLPEF